MTAAVQEWSRLEAKRREQTPQALARLILIGLFIGLWGILWLARMPMPVPFLLTLLAEVLFFLAYMRFVQHHLRSVASIEKAHYAMLGAEIVFHTTIVYFLGGIAWLGAFAYVFGLIFTNTFLDLRRGLIYAAGIAGAFGALMVFEATGVIPHYAYGAQGPNRYADPEFVLTTAICSTGVLFSIAVWINWVGAQMRRERDAAVRAQDGLLLARAELQLANIELEDRVRMRTSDLEHANGAVQENEQLLRATLESTADGILCIDGDGHVAHANSRFVEMWRIPDQLLATRDDNKLLAFVLDQLADADAFIAKVQELYQTTREDLDTLLFKDGRIFERYSRPLIRDDHPSGRVWSFRDVTQERRAEESLREQARHDALTGTLNHAEVTEQLRVLVEAGEPLAVVMVDVDGMKAANDTYGHQVGDQLLVVVARALAKDGAIVGRYGGDEFLAIIAGDEEKARAYRDAIERALAASELRDQDAGTPIPALASIGFAMFPAEAAAPADLIKLADSAMYAAKRQRLASRLNGVEADRAARVVGDLVPLLTAPGSLQDKLHHVAQRLSEHAGYHVVNFSIESGSELRETSTFAVRADLVAAWERERSHRATPTGPIALIAQRTRRPVIIDDLPNDLRLSEEQRRIIRAAGLRCSITAPMLRGDDFVGVISVASRDPGSLGTSDAQFLMAVANQVTAMVSMATLVDQLQAASSRLQHAHSETVVLLAAAAEAHDHTTGRHLQRVRALTEALAVELGFSHDDAAALGLAGVLHDIGKIRVPDAILVSPLQLSDDEWRLMKQHTIWGAEFLASRPGYELAVEVARAHHERWDGTGYPFALATDEIPTSATIVSVADCLDAMTNDRPYRAGRTLEWAIREIERNAGTQFSPRVVDALVQLYERDALPITKDTIEADEELLAA